MNIKTPDGNVAHPHLFKAQEFKKKNWNSVELVYADPKALDDFKAKIKDHVKSKLNGKIPAKFRWPWRTCDDRVDDETGSQKAGYPKGGEFLRIKRNVDEYGQLELIQNESNEPATPREIYAGCKGRCIVYAHVYAGVDGGPPGVTLCLEGFQKRGEGDRIGPTPVSSAAFDDDEI